MSYNALASSSRPTSGSTAAGPNANPPSDRLYVGNLSPSVDEYTLIQIFQKIAPIRKLDFLFHKSGPLRGKPRGFAFVEFGSKEDATKALNKLNGRILRGRNLVVTFASQTQHEPSQTTARGFRRKDDAVRTTTLSLIKGQRKPLSAAQQIAALEAKLSKMQNSPLASASASTPPSTATPADGSPARYEEDFDMEGLEEEVEGGDGGLNGERADAERLLENVLQEIEGVAHKGASAINDGPHGDQVDVFVTPGDTLVTALTPKPKEKGKGKTKDAFDMDAFLGKNNVHPTSSGIPRLLPGAGLPVKPSEITLSTARTAQRMDPMEEERRRH